MHPLPALPPLNLANLFLIFACFLILICSSLIFAPSVKVSIRKLVINLPIKFENMSSHEQEMQEKLMAGLGGDGFLSEFEEEVSKIEERRVVQVPVEFEDTMIVREGAQVPGAVERVTSRAEAGELVGSRCLLKGNEFTPAALREWTYSSEVQRDMMATKLVSLRLFSIQWKKFPNCFVAQLTHMNGHMDWVLVENGFSPDSIGHALCSRIYDLTVLFYCEEPLVRVAVTRYVTRKGVCLGWAQWDPEVYQPPRWPCRRGESALDVAEVGKRFLERVEEWKKKKGSLPRVAELAGCLAAQVRSWQQEQRWNKKGDKKPCWPVMMPNKLFGCPLRPEYAPGPTGGVVPREVAMEVEEEEVEAGEEEGQDEQGQDEQGQDEQQQQRKGRMSEEEWQQWKKDRNRKWYEKSKRKRAAKRAAEEEIKAKIAEKQKEWEEVARVVEQEKREKLAVKERELEELKKEVAAVQKEPRKKRSKVEEAKGAKGDDEPAHGQGSTPEVVPSASEARRSRGGHRGRGRGRGGWRHDHGGFRQNQSLQHEEISRQYRHKNSDRSVADSSFSSAASMPNLGHFDPRKFVAGLCFLGDQALSLQQSNQPAAPIAASSPVASRQQHGRGRSGSRSRGGGYNNNNNNNSSYSQDDRDGSRHTVVCY